MWARWLMATLVLVVLASCGGSSGDQGVHESSTSSVTSSSTAPTSTAIEPAVTSTSSVVSTPTPPVGQVAYYRYGEEGLLMVSRGTETPLVDKPVTWAANDLMGGVIYRLHWRLDAETTYWLRADGSTETLIPDPLFVVVIDGRPSAVDLVSKPDEGDDRDLRLTDLQTGNNRRVKGGFFDGDGWLYPTSYGGGLFVGVAGSAFGCGYSDSTIVVWDDNGNQIDHPHNPAAQPCGPCELSAAISPDGRLLAYTRRSDSPSEYHGRLECGPEGAQREEWWESTQNTLGELVVIDLETGSTEFEVATAAQTFVSDFDGRYLVVETSRWWAQDWPTTTLYDTLGEQPPLQVEGGITLSKAPIDSITLRQDGLGAVSFGESVDDVTAVLTELLGPPDWAEIQVSADTDLSVRWDDPFLYLQFTDWDHFQAAPEPPVPLPEGPVFHYYLTKSDFLATEAGITAGSTVGELKAAYPDVRFAVGCYETEREFVLDPPEEWLHLPMWGLLEGESVDDDTKIEFIGAGWDRSPC